MTLSAEPGATLRWLPQETILFDRARLHRGIEVDLSEGASLLLAEAVIFGRTAMGESVRSGELIDRWRIRRDGRLVFAETLRLGGDIGALLARPAAGNGAVALATVLLAPGDEALVETVRDCACGLRQRGGDLGLERDRRRAPVREATPRSCGAIWFRCSMPPAARCRGSGRIEN